MKKPMIGVFVGSLRKGSYNKIVAEKMAELLAEKAEMRFIEMGELPFYNQDLDEEGLVPKPWADFREQVAGVQALLFVTPEYNRSVPAVLKNALDVGSRPYGQSVWTKKPGAVISVSTGQIGGFGANHHLRQSLTFLDVYTMQQPEVYLSNIESALTDSGELQERTTSFLTKVADAFLAWVAIFKNE